MKKNFLKSLLPVCCILLMLNACKKDYITGGTPEDINQYKNTTTYDVLKSDAAYDTLIQVLDAAGLQEKINEQNVTFFAPSDWSILFYLNARTVYDQATISQDAKFGLDSLLYYVSNNVNHTKDSLLMYLIHESLPYSALTNTGAYYDTELGNSVVVSYEYTKDGNLGYNPVVSSEPQIEYFTQMWYPYTLNDDNPAGSIPLNIGVHTLVKTSGIITQTGILNELENSHTLFFYGTKQ